MLQVLIFMKQINMNIKKAIIKRNHKANDNSFVNDCDIDYSGNRKNYERD